MLSKYETYLRREVYKVRKDVKNEVVKNVMDYYRNDLVDIAESIVQRIKNHFTGSEANEWAAQEKKKQHQKSQVYFTRECMDLMLQVSAGRSTNRWDR